MARRVGLLECLEAAARAQTERHGGAMSMQGQVGAALTGLWYWVYGLPGSVDSDEESTSPHSQSVAAMRSTLRLIAAVVGVMALAYIGFVLRG